jgi:hypothetical protein
MARRIPSVVVPFAVAAVLACAAPTAGQATRQDTLRRQTAEQYQAMRRQWLEARRMGMIVPPPVAYGSAIVGLPSPGAATATIPGSPAGGGMVPPITAGGRVELLCEGWFGPGPGLTWVPRTRAADPGADESGLADAVRRTDPRGMGYGFDGTCVPYGYGNPGVPAYGPGVPGYGSGVPGYGPGLPGYGPGARGYGYAPAYGNQGPYGPGPTPYDPFNPVVPGWGGWTGVTEYMWGPWGPVPMYPYGWQSTPGSGYGFAWPGTGAGECALVTVTAAGGVGHSIAVGVQTLGLSDLADLDLAIDMRLSQGQAVTLLGIDGRVLRLTPGPGIEDIRVSPCVAL